MEVVDLVAVDLREYLQQEGPHDELDVAAVLLEAVGDDLQVDGLGVDVLVLRPHYQGLEHVVVEGEELVMGQSFGALLEESGELEADFLRVDGGDGGVVGEDEGVEGFLRGGSDHIIFIFEYAPP